MSNNTTEPGALIDRYNRAIEYLRISVTTECNLRCIYCRPSHRSVVALDSDQLLTNQEIIAIVTAAARLGVYKIRLTGGEPLLRRDLLALVRGIAAIPGIRDLPMTTNGILLAESAEALAQAGLTRVNVSLDTLRHDRFRAITGADVLDRVLAGLHAAAVAGLTPIKINVVAMRGVNDDEFPEFARLARENNWNVRFIEMMPFGNAPMAGASFISAEEIRSRLGPLLELPSSPSSGPARTYGWPDSRGTVGFISPVSKHFCDHCNRLRLTADGRLRPCLLVDNEVDVKTMLRAGADQEALIAFLREVTWCKPAGHRLAEGIVPHLRTMTEIGG